MRVRIRFTKLGKVRFTSHRDAARIWERACRRAELPVAYSVGFSPRPRLHFGLALSTGHESLAEYLDVDLEDGRAAGIDAVGLPAAVSAMLPDGMVAQRAMVIPPGTPSLQEAVTACTWRIDVADATPEAVGAALEAFLAAEVVLIDRERKGERSTDDIRPAVLAAEVDGAVELPDGRAGTRLVVELATIGRSLRPGELVGALVPDDPDVRVLRTHQWIDAGGARREPIPLAATPAGAGREAPAGGAP
ncbi:MAG: TIGR03936 family radical SAM-associated protein [Acidimicrobiales bacterium]